MAHPKHLKKKARSLRRRGRSYREIGLALSIAKSTAKLWCRDIVLSAKHRAVLYSKQIEILSRGPQSSHERRKREVEAIMTAAAAEVPATLHPETVKLFGAALYWAEGSKTKHFMITNSDPLLIKYFMVWVRKVFEVHPTDIKARLNLHEGQNEKDMQCFWADLTEIPLANFGKSFIKPLNKGYKRNTLYYGTISLRVNKGTDLRIRVFGWMRGVMRQIAPEVEKFERKWYKLREYKRPL